MANRYAGNTSVSVGKSQGEIKDLVQKYGADSFQLGETKDIAAIMFEMNDRRIRFVLPLPDRQSDEFWKTPERRNRRNPDAAHTAWEQACRSRWRALLLAIKAKLEAVEVGIAEFEDEFLANIVMPDGKTVSSHVRPTISSAYDSGEMQPLIPYYG